MVLGAVVGHYTSTSCSAWAGMGRVYLASHTNLPNKRYAFKVLLGEHSASTMMRARFTREAERASQLDHPENILVTSGPEGATADRRLRARDVGRSERHAAHREWHDHRDARVRRARAAVGQAHRSPRRSVRARDDDVRDADRRRLTVRRSQGLGPTGTLSNTTSAQRNDGGCGDSNDNRADFTVAAPCRATARSHRTSARARGV